MAASGISFFVEAFKVCLSIGFRSREGQEQERGYDAYNL
jgi:hypothetical protein